MGVDHRSPSIEENGARVLIKGGCKSTWVLDMRLFLASERGCRSGVGVGHRRPDDGGAVVQTRRRCSCSLRGLSI